MTDEPEQDVGGGNPPFFNNVTKWIGGLTAVVLALAGLKAAAGQLDLFGSAKPADPQQAAANEPDAPADAEPATAPAEQAALPTKYTGTWEGRDVTLELRNGIWVETTAEGTDDEIVTHYEPLSRTNGMTNAVDRDRKLYVRWPSDGGTLEESEDNDTWTRSYDVSAA
jgi:hypothetical protein